MTQIWLEMIFPTEQKYEWTKSAFTSKSTSGATSEVAVNLQKKSSTFPFTISWRVERQVNLQNTMKEVLSTNGSFTIIAPGLVESFWN